MDQITENSFYATPTEKEELLKDKEKVANAFFINFLGTLGLFAISSSRGIMKTYFPDDGKLQLVNIGDANKDTSLAVKLYSDVGGLKPGTTNKITRLLAKLKTRAITSKNFDEEMIREIVQEIQYLSHRPHPIILNVVKQFESGAANLKQVAKAFFQLVKTRKNDFAPVAQEFYAIARQYQIYLKDIPELGSVPSTDDASLTTVATTVATTVPHATKVTATVEPVSNVVNQKAKADKIQTVAKTTPIKDEDFYLMLWKATSGREVSKLLKERGYDSFTPELLQKACEYFLPSTDRSKEAHVNMAMNLMPKVEEFLKGFGQAMAKDPKYQSMLGLVLLYKASLGKTKSEIMQVLEASKKYIRRLYKIYNHYTLIGLDSFNLRERVYHTMLSEFQRNIISAGPSDDIDGMFKMFYADMGKLTDVVGDLKWQYDYATTFPSKLSVGEKIKYLVAVASEPRYEFEKAIGELLIFLNNNGIAYTEKQRSYKKVVNVPKYDNLFPGSKECIDSWYKLTRQNLLSFGQVDFYSEIAKNWKNFLEVFVTENIENIPENESEVVVAEKILARIKQSFSNNDDIVLLVRMIRVFSDTISYTVTNRAEAIINSFWGLTVKYFRSEVEQGKIDLSRIDKSDRTSFVRDMHSLILDNFSKTSNSFNNEQWADYVGFMKASFAKNDELKKELLDLALKEGVVNIDKVLPYVNMDWGSLVRFILDGKDDGITSGGIRVLMQPKSSQYLTDEDYKEIATNFVFSLPKFLELCAVHNVDPSKYVPYRLVKKWVFDFYTGVFHSDIGFEYLKHLFDGLKEEDKLELIDIIKGKITFFFDFTKRWKVDNFALERLELILGKEKTNEYLNSMDVEKKKTFLVDTPNYFFDKMSANSINATLSSYFDTFDPKIAIPNSFSIIQGIAKRLDEITLENMEKIVVGFSKYDRKLNPSARREFEQYFHNSMAALYKKNEESANKFFLEMPLDERRALVKYLIDERYIEKALGDIQGDGVLIKPLTEVTNDRLKEILKYNDIQLPNSPKVDEGDTLTEVLARNTNLPSISKLHVTIDELTEEQLERMSVEYDTFNRYAHGNISLKFVRSFNVSVPVQEEGFKNWLSKLEQEGVDPKFMKPVFHGTGSIGASMILRYGFKVIKSSDPSVVGRMLGNGIYFSNVLDKVAQYISDSGYSRKVGNQGYIFEMEGSLGKHKRDYRCAGTGTPEDESQVISPEWAVFRPNEQLRIYKAHLVELIDKSDMEKLKKKHLGTNESTAVEIKSFKQFLNEGTSDMPHCTTYIFMDGTIPISDNEVVDFKNFNAKKFGKNVKLDWTGSGPSVAIYNNKETATYAVRYTREFMKDMKSEFSKYLKLLNGKK